MPGPSLTRLVAALALATWLGSTTACETAGRGPVILVTVDTLRADRLGALGNAGALPTPNMDRLGNEGAVAHRAVAPMGRTTQSVATILTGLHPLHHGADGLGMPLPDRVVTLAERFRESGWATAAFVSNIHLRPGLGFEQGFEIYSNPRDRWEGNSAERITREALEFLRERGDASRTFVWIHYLDPHWKYAPSDDLLARADPEWTGTLDIYEREERGDVSKGRIIYEADAVLSRREIEHLRRRYDAEVAATDRAIGRLLDGLDESGLGERAVVLLTSDHGEGMGEHRYWFGHGEYLYDDTLHVPWLVRSPGRIPAGTRLQGVVRLEDTAPTLLSLAGLEVPRRIDGQDLGPELLRGGTRTVPPAPAVHLSDWLLLHPENPRRWKLGREGRWWGLRDGPWKLLRMPTAPGQWAEELFHVDDDPDESRNLVAERPGVAARMRDRLLRVQRGVGALPAAGPGVGPEQRKMLRSLGYVDGGG